MWDYIYVSYDTIKKAEEIHLPENSAHYRTTSSQANAQGLREC